MTIVLLDESQITNSVRGTQELPVETTVLICGGGPSGLLTAIKLANCGIRSLVLEKHPSRNGHPKAHAINSRSLEIFRQAGLDTAHLRSLGASAGDADMVRFVLSVKGLELGNLPYERQDEAVKAVTPEPLFNLPQPVLEQFLYEKALNLPLITVIRSFEWRNCEEGDEGLIYSTILNRKTQEICTVRSKYFIGCDGAHARSRDILQIPFDTLDGRPPQPVHYASAHFKADLTKEKTGQLWFIMSRVKSRFLIAYDRSCSWVIVEMYDPEQTNGKIFTDDYFKTAIREAVGADFTFEILNIARWTTTPQTARYYRSKTIRHGFIAGDAAHCFPPTGGLGINTGIADVHNLVWKIAAVERQWCKENILDTYSRDRRPVAYANARQSAENEKKIHQLGMAVFGHDYDEAVENRVKSPRARQEISEAVDGNAEHFDSLNLQIGYIYSASDHMDWADNVSKYTPKCIPGARLPHGWVVFQGKRCSTLDLVEEFNFTLFTIPGFTQEKVLYIGLNIVVNVKEAGDDFQDEGGLWLELLGLDSTFPALLIRPDQHIIDKETLVTLE